MIGLLFLTFGVLVIFCCTTSVYSTTTTQSNKTKPNQSLTKITQYVNNDNSSKSDSTVAICACFLNEDGAIIEWIEYHLMIGVSKIFLYHLDNHSNKNRWRQLLWPYVSRGQVELHPQVLTYLGQFSFRQSSSLQYCYDTYRHDFDWMAFIDIDEFLVPRNSSVTLPDLLHRYRNESGLAIPMRSFGPVVEFNESSGKMPRITDVTNATVYDYRNGYFTKLSGTVKIIVNTNHASAPFCFFVFSERIKRFVGYAHNCLYQAPSPPVNEYFRPMKEQWVLPYPATNDIIQLNHYFIRTCTQHFGEKIKTRRASIKKRYGYIPRMFHFRLGIGLGNTTAEMCANTQASFNTSDTTILDLGRRVWEKIESEAKTKQKHYKLPPRGLCHACLPQAYCVDLLRPNQRKATCVCHEPLIGDGQTFCGKMTWATSVKTSMPGNFSYLQSSPNGDRRPSSWMLASRSADFTVSFSSNDISVSDVRMIAIYQPFSPNPLATLSYTYSNTQGQKESKNIDLSLVQKPGKEMPSFLLINVDRISLRSVILRFSRPVLLGAVGIVVAK